MLYSFLVGVALALLPTTNALIPSELKRYHGFAPQTTDAPFLMPRMTHPHGLGKQQKRETSVTGATWTVAPDETCGYLSGSVGAPITCEDDYATCQWNVPAGFLCEGSKTGTGHITCYDREDALNTDKCNDVCTSDIYNLLCTDTSSPYCRTYVYPSDVSDYRCASTPATRVSSASWTYDGQDNPGFSTTVYDMTMTSAVDSRTSSTDVVTSTESTTTTQSKEPTHSPDPKNHVGAIVGGVVGGLVVVGFVILGTIYLLRRKRPQNESITMMNTKPHVASTAQPPSVGSPVQSEWRGSSVTSPESTMSPVPLSELSAPPGYSNSIHELSGNQNNMH